MSNKDQPLGLQPFGRLIRIQEYVAGATIVPHSPVQTQADGKVDPWASGAILGVALTNAVDTGKVLVADHPDQTFSLQASAAEVDAQTDIGLNYTILPGTDDTVYKISRAQLDSSTGATTAALPLKLLRIMPSIGNALGAKVDCVVKINNHQLAGGTGTDGV